MTLLKFHGNVKAAVEAVARGNPDQKIVDALLNMVINNRDELEGQNFGIRVIDFDGFKYIYTGMKELVDLNSGLVNHLPIYPLEVYKL